MKKYLAALFLCVFADVSASPTIENSKTISNVGVETGHAYFRVVEPLSVTCQYSVIYIDTSTSTGRAQLALLISARALGQKLSVLAYSQDSTGLCWASSLEMAY
jgi:hypothetical protein